MYRADRDETNLTLTELIAWDIVLPAMYVPILDSDRKDVEELVPRIEPLVKAIEEAHEALKFYADGEKYINPIGKPLSKAIPASLLSVSAAFLLCDKGEAARKALAMLEPILEMKGEQDGKDDEQGHSEASRTGS